MRFDQNVLSVFKIQVLGISEMYQLSLWDNNNNSLIKHCSNTYALTYSILRILE